MTKKSQIKMLSVIFTATLLFLTPPKAQAAGNIDASHRFAWSSNAGWVNFNPNNFGGVSVYADHLEGYAWAENVGWILLGTKSDGSEGSYANDGIATYGVNHDGAGNLSGYAWSTNAGWINFAPSADGAGVTLNLTTGDFDGYAWCESIGWIHFKNPSPAYNVSINLTHPSGVTSSAANGTYKKGDTVPVDVEFTRSVTVTGGPPQLTLETSDTDPDAIVGFTSGNGTPSLTFDYIVETGHKNTRLDYAAANSLVLNGATIIDDYGLSADLTLPAPGATGSLSVNKYIVIDGVAPPAPTVYGTTPTNAAAWTWSASTMPPSDGNGIFRYSLDRGAFFPETTDKSYSPQTPLSHGPHTLKVQERDAAGNWSAAGEKTIDVDIQPPTAAVSGTPASPTKNTSAALTVSGTDVTHYRYELDNTGYKPETPVGTPISLTLTHGDHTVSVIGRDAVGNWQSSPTTVSWTVDTQAPTAVISDAPASPTNAISAAMTVGGDGVVAYRYNLDNAGYEPETPATDPITLSSLSSQAHTLSVIGKDEAGNWQPEDQKTVIDWTVDTTPPVADLANPPSSPIAASSFSFTVNGGQVTHYQVSADFLALRATQ